MTKKNILITIINYSIAMILLCNMTFEWNKQPESWSIIIRNIMILIFIYQMIILKIYKYRITDFIFWFITLNYLFLFGRVILISLGLEDKLFWKVGLYYSISSCYRAGLFSLCYLQLLFCGIMTSNVTTYQSKVKKNKKDNKYTEACIKFVGIYLFLVTMPFKIIYDYLTVRGQRDMGNYVAVVDGVNGVIVALSALPVVAIIFMTFSSLITRVSTKRILTLYFAYSTIIMIFSGDRRQFVISTIACALAYMEMYKLRLSYKRILGCGTLVLVGLFIISAIRIGRGTVIRDLDYFLELLLTVISENNIIYEVFAEFGLTFYTIVATIEFYPSRFNYLFGKEYLYCILVIVPTVISFFPKLAKEAQISKQIKSVYNQGLGGSLPQGLYANFSIFGVLLAPLYGKIIKKLTTKKINSSKIDLIFYYVNFYILLNLVRAGLGGIVRYIVYGYILIELFAYIYWKRIKNR